MISKRFKLHIYLRVFLLLATVFLFVFSLLIFKLYITATVILIIMVLQIQNLIYFVTQTNRSLSRFIDSIRQKDFSVSFSPAQKDSSFRELSKSFNAIVDTFRDINAEKEAKHIFLKTLIENIPSAIISFDKKGEVELVNERFKSMFAVPYIKNIKALERFSGELVTLFHQLKHKQKKLFRMNLAGEQMQLSVNAVELVLNEKEIRIITLADIRKELDSKEIDAWQKLIRVLTHEIMNSLSPVTSLSSSLTSLVEDDGKLKEEKDLTAEDVEDLRTGLKTITKRGEGLMDFVQSYRSLIKIPKPNFEMITVRNLLNNVEKLLYTDCKEKGINLKLDVRDDFDLFIDEKLVEQILINLVKNATEAVVENEDKRIVIKTFIKQEKKCISVIDNGSGISSEDMDKIFIPFYSTKPKGSGIGLSLSKQLMQLHNGKIEVLSALNKGTEVQLIF